jgi:pimeloyl-ACP methyl ester carboxylesterase
MNDLIRHLPGIEVARLDATPLHTQLLMCGPEEGEPVLFLHGNLSTSTFWEETMLALPEPFRAVAPDLRGYGRSNPAARIDATRGVADWADDVVAWADFLGWDRFHLVAHSLGGCVGWALLGGQSERLHSVTLVAPGPPCGFGGAHGERGELNHNDGAGSGAGLVHPNLVSQLEAGDRDVSDKLFSPRGMLNRLYWKPPFRPVREEQLLTAMLEVHLGEGHFPGDWLASPHWPGFAPANYGPINAISPRYNGWVLPQLLAAPQKVRLLWVHGTDDPIICDASLSDSGTQGKLGLRPDWPGAEIFPPQPLLQQVAFAIDRYEEAGGSVQRLLLPSVGHTPYLEQPVQFQATLVAHLKAR